MGRAYKANQQQDRQGPAGLQSTRTAEGTLARDRCGAFRDFVAAIGRIGNLSRLHDGRENFHNLAIRQLRILAPANSRC